MRDVYKRQEVEAMCPLAKGAYHGPAPIPQEGKWTQAKEVTDISGLTHGIGWCAPQPVSYTHLDVYKRQAIIPVLLFFRFAILILYPENISWFSFVVPSSFSIIKSDPVSLVLYLKSKMALTYL